MTSRMKAALFGQETWPDEAEEKYERIEVLGKGSFGMVWMARRVTAAENKDDDEFVAVKNILIKDEKSNVYAEREISILQELRHPNVIRLIRSYPSNGNVRLVVLELARGPNLHQLVVRRGALGMPLARQVSRELISAVAYLHGRGCLHRDIKPSNVILACHKLTPTDDYDWYTDDAIWSNGQLGDDAVANKKWRLMLVDFGFARALEMDEITLETGKHLRNSIIYENTLHTGENGSPARPKPTPGPSRTSIFSPKEGDENEDDVDSEELAKMAEDAAAAMIHTPFIATNEAEDAVMGRSEETRKRLSGVSMLLPEGPPPTTAGGQQQRQSTSYRSVRSMSALGTKAYAAPEIRKQLRHKNEEDFSKANAAMTECVADYGMIVDAYSVGWTLRVIMTGVPPNFTISEYVQEREAEMIEDDDDDAPGGCCCGKPPPFTGIRVRDPAFIPTDATLLITRLIEKQPEDRLTVREAQNHPWIAGAPGEPKWKAPIGDVPSKHGDPVVPLACAQELSKLTIDYHMQ